MSWAVSAFSWTSIAKTKVSQHPVSLIQCGPSSQFIFELVSRDCQPPLSLFLSLSFYLTFFHFLLKNCAETWKNRSPRSKEHFGAKKKKSISAKNHASEQSTPALSFAGFCVLAAHPFCARNQDTQTNIKYYIVKSQNQDCTTTAPEDRQQVMKL